ncbi:MAG: hypothetical protein AAB583_04645 [Patescibacteria group bacterium]
MEGVPQDPNVPFQNPEALAQNQLPTDPNEPPKHHRLTLFVIIGIIVIVLFGLSTTIMAAYGIIPLANKSLQNSIANFVIGLPFMPKTPNFVLKSAILAHEKVTQFTIDASLATTSTGISEIIGTGNFDIRITGPIDYSDPNNPTMSLKIKLSKDFDLDIIAKDKITYFKVNQIPATIALLLANFGYDESIQNEFLNKWFYADTSPLDTEARKALEEKKENTSITKEVVEKLFNVLEDPQLKKSISMQTGALNSYSTYQIHFVPDESALNLFWEKYLELYNQKSSNTSENKTQLSDYIEKFTLDSWIDKESYFVRKIATTFTIKFKQNSPTQYSLPNAGLLPFEAQEIPVSIVVNLSDFGKPAIVTAPTDATNINDFMKSLTEKIATKSGNLAEQFSQANN